MQECYFNHVMFEMFLEIEGLVDKQNDKDQNENQKEESCFVEMWSDRA